ncbi:MAG TPA: hypothetical protein VKJ45_28785 [Blastocatellia bacterium]|nr:hypothetical protein [Blastocatellia bacterium]
MRNRFGIELPTLFEWKVARAGYRWIDSLDGTRICAVDAEQPDWFGSDGYETPYHPLERTGLFREFAGLAPTAKGILDFANRFGLLGIGGNFTLETESDAVLVRAEPFALWKQEIQTLKMAVAFWDIFSASGGPTIVRKELQKLNLPSAVRRRLHLDDDDPGMAALSFVQTLTDPRLQEHTSPRLLFQGNLPRLELVLMPSTLLGALWLQFSLAIDGLKRFIKCSQCGAPFELSRDKRTGKRADAQFCSVRCRVGHYRARIDEARRFSSAGLSSKEIALRLNTDEATVSGWLRGMNESAAPTTKKIIVPTSKAVLSGENQQRLTDARDQRGRH